MGAGHVTELGGTVLGPASGSAQVGAVHWQARIGWTRFKFPAAEALVPCMFPPSAAETQLSRPRILALSDSSESE